MCLVTILSPLSMSHKPNIIVFNLSSLILFIYIWSKNQYSILSSKGIAVCQNGLCIRTILSFFLPYEMTRQTCLWWLTISKYPTCAPILRARISFGGTYPLDEALTEWELYPSKLYCLGTFKVIIVIINTFLMNLMK